MKKILIPLLALLFLSGCSVTIKTAENNFNQTTGACDPKVTSTPRTVTNESTQDTGRSSTNSGGSGNTVIIIESSAQGSKADPNLSGAAEAAAKLAGGAINIPSVASDIGAAVSPAGGNVPEVE